MQKVKFKQQQKQEKVFLYLVKKNEWSIESVKTSEFDNYFNSILNAVNCYKNEIDFLSINPSSIDI